MIVWGGAGCELNTGARYNPSTDSWTTTSTHQRAEGRYFHTAVWTGTEMIVWGGESGTDPFYLDNGGRYNPGTDSWTPISITNAPSADFLKKFIPVLVLLLAAGILFGIAGG